MNFKGAALPMSHADVKEAAKQLRTKEPEIWAVLEVESRGKGFDKQGRPSILFEPHIFYRQLKHRPIKRAVAVAQGLAYRRWRPGTYGSFSSQYPKLQRAIKIDQHAALRSCSWGLGQLMGFHAEELGFKDVVEMVEAMKSSEGEQLMAMVQHIIVNRIDDDLRDHHWSGFARIFNGSGYRKHNYHKRLAAAYRKHAGKESRSPVDGMLRVGAKGKQVNRLQNLLNKHGFNLTIDSDFGPATRRALRAFQRQNKLVPDGIAGPLTWTKLKTEK